MAPTQVAHDIQPIPVPARRRPIRSVTASNTSMGLFIAILSCAAFGTAGTLGKGLLSSGWSPVTAVAARIGIASVALSIPAVMSLRGRWHLLVENRRSIVLYGMFGVAGCQLFYFNAVTHISVGVALLIEYLAPVLLVGYAWMRYGRTPRTLTIAGTLAAIVGLLFVLDVFSGISADPIGIAWALGAAVCLTVYFVIAGNEESELPSMALAGAGMGVGALILLALCAVRAFPVSVSTQDVTMAGAALPFWIPMLALGLIGAALAYGTGIMAARALGTKVASFVSLLEVVFAVLFAWALLGEAPTAVQLVGGAFILGGVILVRMDESRQGEHYGPVVAAEQDEQISKWVESGDVAWRDSHPRTVVVRTANGASRLDAMLDERAEQHASFAAWAETVSATDSGWTTESREAHGATRLDAGLTQHPQPDGGGSHDRPRTSQRAGV